LITVPHLGLLTTSLAGTTDAAIVERSWGLHSVIPSLREHAYGPRFSFREFYRPSSRLHGIVLHWALGFFGFLLVTLPPIRGLAKRFVYQPGEGQDRTVTKNDKVEYRGVAKPDAATETLGFCRAWHHGGVYYREYSALNST
jgi:hypothetical protein